MKIIYGTVIYPTIHFSKFITDYLMSVSNQTYKKFTLLIILDQINKQTVANIINENFNNLSNYKLISPTKPHTPIELRKILIDESYALDADILIFSDFDECVTSNRVQRTIESIDGNDFIFNDFYIVNKDLEKMHSSSYFSIRNIPDTVDNWNLLKFYNFIGLGSLAINLQSFDFRKLSIPSDIIALDWFLATWMLLNGAKGLKLPNVYAFYRQHDSSLVGFDFKLNKDKVQMGLKVKLAHYKYFSTHSDYKTSIIFQGLYKDILNLQNFLSIHANLEKYIDIINTKFDRTKFCWWENIKPYEAVINES